MQANSQQPVSTGSKPPGSKKETEQYGSDVRTIQKLSVDSGPSRPQEVTRPQESPMMHREAPPPKEQSHGRPQEPLSHRMQHQQSPHPNKAANEQVQQAHRMPPHQQISSKP